MDPINPESFSKLLQYSISPVVLISSVGLLLLSVTNRLGRTIDRSRSLAKELDEAGQELIEDHTEQLKILVRRAEFLRNSVTLIVASVFFSCLMVLFLFLLVFLGVRLEVVVLALFCLSVFSLLGSVIYFFADVLMALHALKIEVARHLTPRSP
ncbi:MAG: DUF2721 domain-containing protein [Methylacidiphilales bacterium]|nr:DUF2721 domain-containing protein [Candidatus Methylacidiphilales bacterium]